MMVTVPTMYAHIRLATKGDAAVKLNTTIVPLAATNSVVYAWQVAERITEHGIRPRGGGCGQGTARLLSDVYR
jgi:hypothetical protein